MGKAEESCRRRALKALGRVAERRHGFKREERAGLDHEKQSGEHGTDRRELVSHPSTSCLRTEAMPHGSLCLAHLGLVVCDSGL